MIWIFLKVEQCTHFQMNHQLRNYFSALCSWSMACWNMALGNVQNCLTRLLTAAHGSHVLSLSCALYVPHFTFGLNFWVFFWRRKLCLRAVKNLIMANSQLKTQIIFLRCIILCSSPPKWNAIKKALFEPPAWDFSNQNTHDLYNIITEENRRLF